MVVSRSNGHFFSCDDVPYEFDDHGRLINAAFSGAPASGGTSVAGPSRPGQCPLGLLNGSWLIEIFSSEAPSTRPEPQIRGPMRIQVRTSSLRISGDVYVRHGKSSAAPGIPLLRNISADGPCDAAITGVGVGASRTVSPALVSAIADERVLLVFSLQKCALCLRSSQL
jgi:hypothetical protein